MKIAHKLLASFLGRNLESTPVSVIIDQMNEKRPLPIGMAEFEEWSDRIISGTLIPAEPDSMKFGLATMLMHLSPTQDHESDGYFIKSLRKSAVNQIAHAKMEQLRTAAKLRLAQEALDKEAVQASTTPAVTTNTEGVVDEAKETKG